MALFPEKMYEVSVVVHKHYFERLLEALHESGLLQLIDYNDSKLIDPEKIETGELPVKRSESLSELILQLNRLRESIKNKEKEDENIFQTLRAYRPPGQNLVKNKPVSELIKNARSMLKELNFINELDAEIVSSRSSRNNLKLQIEKLKLFEKMKIDLGALEPTPNIGIKIGLTENAEELRAELYNTLSPRTIDNGQFALYVQKYSNNSADSIVIIIVPSHEISGLRKVMVGRNFKELEISGYLGTPGEVIQRLEKESIGLDNKISRLKSKLDIAERDHFMKISILIEELEIARKRIQVQSKFGQTKSTHILCGWCLKRQIGRLKGLCEDITGGHYSITYQEPENSRYEEVPVKLNNPKWAKPFEMLTTTFAVPRYGEIDPTVIIAPLFVLFFGIMLGDAGYGSVILILSAYGYIKFGKASRTIHNMSTLGIYLGITTLIAGILMGTFFGDFIQRFIYKDPGALLYTIQVGGITLPYDSFKEPMLLFAVSLIMGLFIINLGLILGALQNMIKGAYKEFLTIQVAWFIIQPPAILLIGQFLLKFWVLSYSVMIISGLVLVIGLGLLSLQYKALTLFEITGFLGDWLSFARLLALSLATIGMALTFNLIGELILNVGYGTAAFAVSIIAACIVLFIVHIFNLFLQTLGAAIHSLRLQYIELFNRCFAGGGLPFRPFKKNLYKSRAKPEKNRYIDIRSI